MRKNLTLLFLSVLLSTVAAVIITRYALCLPDRSEPAAGFPAIRQVTLEQQNFPDFTYAAESCVDGVVFVKVVKREKNREASILEHFFGYGNPYSMPRESVGSGSGVIISPDG